MIRAVELVAVGLSRATVYYRARQLGITGEPGKPMRFSKAEAHRIIHYQPARAGRKPAGRRA